MQWITLGGLVARSAQRFAVDDDVLANLHVDVDEPLSYASSYSLAGSSRTASRLNSSPCRRAAAAAVSYFDELIFRTSIGEHYPHPAAVRKSWAIARVQIAVTTMSNRSSSRVRSTSGSVRFSNGVKTAARRFDIDKPSVRFGAPRRSQSKALASFKRLAILPED